jgi:predicted transcriptional regulator
MLSSLPGQAFEALNYTPRSEDEAAIIELFNKKIIPGAKDLELFLSAFAENASMDTQTFGVLKGKKRMREKLSQIWSSIEEFRMENVKINLKGLEARVQVVETWITSGGTRKYESIWTLKKSASEWLVVKKRISR